MKQPKFIAVDFFCGAGGTTRGLLDAGGYVIAGIDKDHRCQSTYTGNNVNATLDCKPVRYLQRDIFPRTPHYPGGQQRILLREIGELIELCRREAPHAPLLFAICAPCQPFTKLARKEMSSERQDARARDQNLLREACRFVAKYKPELVLSENVSGIRDPKYGGIWEGFRRRLERLGYATGSKIVCASKFGVPQFRRRSILAAARRELVRAERFVDLVQSELIIPEADSGTVISSVASAIGHLPPLKAGHSHPDIPNHKARALSELNYKRLSSASPGQSNAYLESTKHGDLSLDCHRRVNEKLKARCFSDVYTRMSPDRPSPTITTRCHSISNGRFGHFDPRQVRGISLREAAILQSFPSNYVFYPEDQIEPVARMIGNAVPPKLAQFFADYLSRSLIGGRRA
jgi:DNA (cytosine-5)-methyltransferase 1